LFRKQFTEKILRVFEISPYRYFTVYRLVRDLGLVTIKDQQRLYKSLHSLVWKGKIEQVYPGKFGLHHEYQFTGVIDLLRPHCPMLVSGSYLQPVHILPHSMQGASHGDTVLVKLCRQTPHYVEAEVLRIIRFAQRILVGTIEVLEQRAYFTPLHRKLFCDIEIPLKYTKQAETGDCVVIRFYHYSQNNDRRIAARVIRVLGESGTRHSRKLVRYHSNGFPAHFTTGEEQAAIAIDFKITPVEITKRLDMREITTFTIDPEGCKDVDDALSFRLLENGNFEIGVHIADVTHYLPPGSVLDRQAYKRATSVYLADHVLHMFPSSFIRGCSLFPQEDKLAFSVIFEMDKNAKVIRRKIAKTVIRSQRQFSYGDAQRLINEPADEIFSPVMTTLFELSQKLRAKRFANGAIAFNERRELCFEVDDLGLVLDVIPYKREKTMSLIEEFMLLANRSIAEMAIQKHLPFVYRYHGSPKVRLFGELCRVATHYGYTLKEQRNKHDKSNSVIAKNISCFLSQIRTTEEASMFQYLAIRSMSQAKYSSVPRRHFALAFDHYTHFTSPIRRYVDIVVHRLMVRELIDPNESTGIIDYEKACIHFNRMRQKAEVLERHSEQQKSAEFLQNKIDQLFDGVIIYVTANQIVVELLKSGIHGRIPLESLQDDGYHLDYATYTVKGGHSGRSYRIGDQLHLRLVSVELDLGYIDFSIVHTLLSDF
jgi:ribonuclease R